MTERRRARRGEASAWIAAFLAAPEQTDDCILWPFGLGSKGYGSVGVTGRKTMEVHALVCEHFHGPRPPGMHACHSHAGNRHCLNPRHLRWDTPAANNADMVAHGTTPVGERNSQAKLTWEQVAEIRRRYVPRPQGRRARPGEGPTLKQLAEEYGVSDDAIHYVIGGKTWPDRAAATR